MKKILYISYYFPPMKSGGTLRPQNFVKYLRKSGYGVTVLTATYKRSVFSENIIRIFDISFNKERKGIKQYIWFSLRIISALLNIIGFSHSIYSWWKGSVKRKSARIMALVKPDLIMVTYPPVETLEIGLVLSRQYHIPLISDFRDGLIFEPIESALLNRNSVARKKYAMIERLVVENSEFIITVSNPITAYFKSAYHKENVATLYTGYDPDDHAGIAGNISEDEKEFFKIVFTGRLNLSDSSNSITVFFAAVKELEKEAPDLFRKIRICLAGQFSGDELKELRDLIKKRVVLNYGYIERNEVIELQRRADLLLIITSISRSSIVTTKVFEYLFSGKPILALTHRTELENILKKTQTGWVVHPRKKKAIKEMLKKIIGDNDYYHSVICDKKKISGYSIENQIKLLDRIIKKKMV